MTNDHAFKVPHVTIEHGRRFADAWIAALDVHSTASCDAFEASGIIAVPEDDAAQYLAITNAILARTWTLMPLREPLALAFAAAANEVFATLQAAASFVALRSEHGTVWVNPTHVSAFYGNDDGTTIHLAGGDIRTVADPPAHVVFLLRTR